MRKLLAPFVVLLLVGCTGVVVPESPRESLTAAEVTYQGVLNTANDFVTQGIIKKGSENAIKVGSAIIAARTALDAWHVVPDNRDRMTTAISALKVVQSLLTTLKQTGGTGA